MADSAFRLSRVQAEGWNAARCIPAAQIEELDDGKAGALNPYRKGPERRRWIAGFKNGLKSLQRRTPQESADFDQASRIDAYNGSVDC
jgi:hypothetical protein